MSSSLLLLVLLALKVHSRGYKRARERDRSQVSGERSERVLREIGCYPAVCSGFNGFLMVQSDLARIDVMCCDTPYGTPYFSFYRLRESTDYSGGKRGE